MQLPAALQLTTCRSTLGGDSHGKPIGYRGWCKFASALSLSVCDWCAPNLTLTDAGVVQGNAEIRAVYGDRSHILIVSTYQMCMLDLFNKADSLTFRYVHVESWSVYAVVGCAISCMLFVPLGVVAHTGRFQRQ